MTSSYSEIASLVEAFTQASGNTEKANALLMLCNHMQRQRIGFPEIRKAFPATMIAKSMTQLSALVTTFRDQDGCYLMPDSTQTKLMTDDTGFETLRRWGGLFIEINSTALDQKIGRIYESLPLTDKRGEKGAELIKQPNMLYAALQKLNRALGL